MSCGMIALERAGIKVDKYFACEIDKYTTQVSEKHYPNIIRLWDVNNRKERNLWEIDIIIWWSPCQWFSFAGKQLAFDDPRSKLFFTMVDIINHYKPKYFLLENVKMKKEHQAVITEYMWVQPIEINSALVSAQNRKRLYRTNIPWIEQPKDKWILLKDIILDEVDDKYNISETQWEKLRNYESNSRLSPLKWKCFSLTTMQWWHRQPKIMQAVWDRDKNNYWIKEDKSYCLPATPMSDRWMMVIQPKIVAMQCGQSKNFDNARWSDKWYTIKTNTGHWMIDLENIIVRKLTPVECERLQTVPDNYTDAVSNSQRYKMLWNWWTVDIIAHIFSYLI